MGYADNNTDVERIITEAGQPREAPASNDQPVLNMASDESKHDHAKINNKDLPKLELGISKEERSFPRQIAAFLILEFSVIFHSVIIDLKLGTAGPECATLYQ